MASLNRHDPADPGADSHADSMPIGICNLDTAVSNSLHASHHSVLDEAIHPPRLFRRQIFGKVELGNLAGNSDRVFECIK